MSAKKKSPKRKPPPPAPPAKFADVIDHIDRLERSIGTIGKHMAGFEESIRAQRTRLDDILRRMDGLVSEFVYEQQTKLAMFACWSRIPEEDGGRLMSVNGGDMTPLYVEWFIATHTKDEVHARYGDRIFNMPPYLREKIK